MNTPKSSPETPAKRRSWLRIAMWLAGIVVILVVVAFFVVTSSGFFKGVILPKVGAAMNADVTVADASISPFSQVVLRKVSVVPHGGDTPLFTADEVRAHYSLMAILGGKIVVQEVALVSPVINVTQNADGTSNLDPLLKGEKAEKPSSPSAKSQPPNLAIESVKLTDGVIRQTTIQKDGSRDTLEVSKLNVTLTNLKNGGSGKLDVSALVALAKPAQPAKAASSLQAGIVGSYSFDFSEDLKPKNISGKLSFNVEKAEGDFADMAALSVALECEVTPTDIKRVALVFQKAGTPLGEVRVSGPFVMEKSEGRLNVEILPIDKRVLNLLGASSGIDFGGTTITSSNQIEITKAGTVIAASGSFNVAQFQLTQAGQTTPSLDLIANYSVTVDSATQSALLGSLTASATQNGSSLVRAELSSPMNLSWGKTSAAVGDSSLAVTVTGLNLADWRAFAADLSPAGVLNANLKLVSQQGGKQLTFDFDGGVSGLSVKAGDTTINQADVRVQAKGRGVDMKEFRLESYQLALSRGGESALTVSGSGDFNSATQDADLQVAMQSVLSRLLAICPQPGVNLTGGTLDFKGRVTSNQKNQSVTGDLSLADLVVGSPNAKPLAAKLQLDVSMAGQVADLRQCKLTLTPTSRAKNEIQLTGRVDLTQTNAITGNLKLIAESLDVTGYYDMFTGQSAGKPAQPSQTAATPAGAGEPESVNLPFRNFIADAAIGRLFLREIDVANLQTTLKLDGGRVLLKPFQMTLNGAPVNASADLNLGVPGYQYDVSFSADRVPLEPLANSFSPEYKGQAKGQLLANAQIKGAGVTGTSLQKSLFGNASFVLTNSNIQLVGSKAKRVMQPIALVLGLDELTKSPLNGLNTRMTMGDGKIRLTQCDLLSDAFQADVTGEIPIAPILTNSPFNNWPINFALSRNLAEKSRLITADTPTNATFVKLPTFVKLAGTIGSPEAKTDKLVIVGLLSRSVAGIGGVGGKVGGILQGVGGLLTGQSSSGSSTNQPATRTTSTNKSAPSNPLEQLFRPKNK